MLKVRAYVMVMGLVVALALLTSRAVAAEQPSSEWSIDVSFPVSPQRAPSPALKYLLLPGEWELKDGNAVPIYLRLALEQSDAARKALVDTPKAWNELPLDKIPLAEAKKFLGEHQYMLRQLEIGARRQNAEWDYTLDEPHPIGLLLPDVQVMRNYAPILVLQTRVALVEKNFLAAARHIQTGLGFARHVARGPTLIHTLVGLAIARQFIDLAQEMIEQPEAPNLYWALTALPRPFIDLRTQIGFEYQTFIKEFPELTELDQPRPAPYWDNLLRKARTDLRDMASITEHGKPQLPDWFPKGSAPDDAAADSPDLAAAREHVARAKHLSTEQVEAMPAAQVLLLNMLLTFEEDRDDWFSAAYLPFFESRRLIKQRIDRLRQEATTSEGHVPGRVFLPAMDKVLAVQNSFERRLTLLQAIESLRMYAASHDGRLPEKLSQVVESPIPDDPGTAKPLDYEADDHTATLISRLPNATPGEGAQRYKITLRGKGAK